MQHQQEDDGAFTLTLLTAASQRTDSQLNDIIRALREDSGVFITIPTHDFLTCFLYLWNEEQLSSKKPWVLIMIVP